LVTKAVGVIHELGAGVTGYSVGQRVLVGAITPCGQCEPCLAGDRSQCGGPLGGWKLGNTIDGTQAEYVLIPHAQANLAIIPNALADEQVLLLADIASTGNCCGRTGGIRIGDTVAIFAQGPIGLCATLGARLLGASEIIAIDSDPQRLNMARSFGATAIVLSEADPVAEILDFTQGRGVDVAIEALGKQETFENALRSLRPGGTLSSVGVYSGHLKMPLEAIRSGLGDQTMVTTLCPGGKERMQRLMRLVSAGRINLTPLLTHLFSLDEIDKAYELFESRRKGVLKIGIEFRDATSAPAQNSLGRGRCVPRRVFTERSGKESHPVSATAASCPGSGSVSARSANGRDPRASRHQPPPDLCHSHLSRLRS
jgi:threonine dehydrogenase-like Zn-dependent dehydrogenase